MAMDGRYAEYAGALSASDARSSSVRPLRHAPLLLLTATTGSASIVETFNNGERMATVNFSVPDEVKDAFNAAFGGRNKSAIVADLLREAVERERRRHEHVAACDAILRRRDKLPRVSAAAVRRAREEVRR